MTFIWVVLWDDFANGWRIAGVFSTQDKATRYAESMTGYDTRVEKHRIDAYA